MIKVEPKKEAEEVNLGSYFTQYSVNMLRGVPPSGVCHEKGKYTCFLLAFVADHAGIFDSVIAKETKSNLEGTLMYKLLTICGTLLKANQSTKTRITWI